VNLQPGEALVQGADLHRGAGFREQLGVGWYGEQQRHDGR